MIILENDCLDIRCPEVHDHARSTIEFQRTLRIPDDGEDYFLPPGLGCFPLRHLDDYAERLPGEWLGRGGVIMPMFQAEALWINFDSGFSGSLPYPFAVKIATGKICALTGDNWVDHLNTDPQDYLVLPEQPWLDGYCVEKGIVRQFVAMPLGEGYTAEEQLQGAARLGGLQIVAYPMKRERYEEMCRNVAGQGFILESPSEMGMGLAPGGRMQQEIYEDPYGLDAWDQRHPSRCFVTIANSVQWMAITGERPPVEPPTARDYTEAGLPWFDYYNADAEAVSGSNVLKSLKSVEQTGKAKGEAPLPENESIGACRVVSLRDVRGRKVREYPTGEVVDS
ncbi:MAG: hypothetical protein OXE44_11645 [Nitrospinae bacterium]|nr:hypothetical protein [Nitrospinota bacterium]